MTLVVLEDVDGVDTLVLVVPCLVGGCVVVTSVEVVVSDDNGVAFDSAAECDESVASPGGVHGDDFDDSFDDDSFDADVDFD